MAYLFEDGVVAEAETAQQGTHLALGPIRHRLEQGVDHAFIEIEGLGLVLFEIAGDHIMVPQAGFALEGLLHAHHQPQQG